MMAAAAAWDALAGQLESFAADYSSVVSELREHHWSGSSSTAMATAATPYVAWATATAAQAEQLATHARIAAAGFETAFAATVPPAAVAANRVQFVTLVATNFLGQNTALIAAVDAVYAEMWAQDAAAMFGYAATSAAAVDMTPFRPPPRTTAAGHSGVSGSQGALGQVVSAVPQHLPALSSAGASGPATPVPPLMQTVFGDFAVLSGPADVLSASARTAVLAGDFVNEVNLYGFQAGNVAATPAAPVATAGAVATGRSRSAVLARLGRAESVGSLSIPQNWTTATAAAGPADRPVSAKTTYRALPSWAAAPGANRPEPTPGSGLGPPARLPARPMRNTARRMRVRRYRIPRPAVGG